MAGFPTLDSQQRIEHCPACGLSLPLCQPTPGETPLEWSCSGCGHTLLGRLDPKYELDLLRHIRPAGFPLVIDELPPPPEEVAEFLSKRTFDALRSVEKRSAPRHPAISHVPAQPLDKMLRAVGPPFLVTTRDLSTKGIGLLHIRPLTEPFLMVQLHAAETEPIQLLVHIVRRRPRGPYYDLAGEFLTKMRPVESRAATRKTNDPAEAANEPGPQCTP